MELWPTHPAGERYCDYVKCKTGEENNNNLAGRRGYSPVEEHRKRHREASNSSNWHNLVVTEDLKVRPSYVKHMRLDIFFGGLTLAPATHKETPPFLASSRVTGPCSVLSVKPSFHS